MKYPAFLFSGRRPLARRRDGNKKAGSPASAGLAFSLGCNRFEDHDERSDE